MSETHSSRFGNQFRQLATKLPFVREYRHMAMRTRLENWKWIKNKSRLLSLFYYFCSEIQVNYVLSFEL